MQDIFHQYLNYLRVERNASPYTIRNYTNDLMGNYARGTEKGFFQFLKLRKIDSVTDVDTQVMRDYLAYLIEQGVVKRSIARKLSAIRSFYRYLMREEIIHSNPVARTVSPKLDKRLPEFLTIDETRRLIETPDISNPEGQRDRAILELLYAAGLRVSELAKLNLENINMETHEIRVMGKGSKERITLMGEPAAAALTTYLNQIRPALLGARKSNAIFLNRYGERLTIRMMQKLLGKYANIVGIEKGVHPHMLRHTFATHLLDGGADLRIVQELLGHASLSTTQIYTHISKAQAKKVYLSAHPLAKEEGETT